MLYRCVTATKAFGHGFSITCPYEVLARLRRPAFHTRHCKPFAEARSVTPYCTLRIAPGALSGSVSKADDCHNIAQTEYFHADNAIDENEDNDIDYNNAYNGESMPESVNTYISSDEHNLATEMARSSHGNVVKTLKTLTNTSIIVDYDYTARKPFKKQLSEHFIDKQAFGGKCA